MLKKIVICLSLIIVAFIVIVSWFLYSLFSEPDMSTVPEYYPFKSSKAQNRYLKYYDERARSWPVDSETLYTTTPYGRTFVRISGPVNAPTLVLLPSTSATSLIWIPNIKSLSTHFRVYAVDNIYDFGRSINTRNIKDSVDMTNWLDELFTSLKLNGNINLVGLSFGGWLTSQYTLRYPNRLNKSIWIAPAATMFDFPGEWVWRGILSAIPHRYFMKKFMIDWLCQDLMKKNDSSSRQILESMTNDAMMGLRSFQFRMPVTPTVLTDAELNDVKIPTLFLIGENEKLYSAQQAIERLHKNAPQIKTEIIPNAGHDLTFVQCELVNNIIIHFLKESA